MLPRRQRLPLVVTAVAVFLLHELALGALLLASMSGLAAHGPAEPTFFAGRAGAWVIGIVGFPFLDLALALRGAEGGPVWWIAGALATSAAWAAAAVWLVRRARAARRKGHAPIPEA